MKSFLLSKTLWGLALLSPAIITAVADVVMGIVHGDPIAIGHAIMALLAALGLPVAIVGRLDPNIKPIK